MVKISEDVLKDTDGEPEKGFKRFIRKVPVGPILVIFPWNVRHVPLGLMSPQRLLRGDRLTRPSTRT